MAELISKLSHRLPEVSDRAVANLCSKLVLKLVTIDELLQFDEGSITGLILQWINERQQKADFKTLSSALKLIENLAQHPEGQRGLKYFGAVEFLEGYYKYATESLRNSIEKSLQLLVSPDFEPVVDKIIPPVKQDFIECKIEQNTKVLKQEMEKINIVDCCEFPPVMLSEMDEKILFDIGVTLKFGSQDDCVQACRLLANQIFKDYQIDVFLQRTDVIKSLCQLNMRSCERGQIDLAEQCLFAMKHFLLNCQEFNFSIRQPEQRPVAIIPKKVLNHSEYQQISIPNLNLEQWENGSPGNTLSLLGCVELILQSVNLEYYKLLGPAIQVWEAGYWAIQYFKNYDNVLRALLQNIGSAIQYHYDNNKSLNECRLFIDSLLKLGTGILLHISPEDASDVLGKNDTLLKFISDFIVFKGLECDDLLPYIEKCDPEALADYHYAQKCAEAIAASQKVKESMMLQQTIPISSIMMYQNAFQFFISCLPALEFNTDLPIPHAIIDLNCYSLILEEDSIQDSKKDEAQGLLLALLNSPIAQIRENTLKAINEGMRNVVEMNGLGKGSYRSYWVKRMILQKKIIPELITRGPIEIIINALENPEDYDCLVPYITLIQSYANTNPQLQGVLHMIVSRHSNTQAIKIIRDIFSKSKTVRALAISTLRNSNCPKDIYQKVSSMSDEYWQVQSVADPLAEMIDEGELEQMPLPANIQASQEDLQNLLRIVQYDSIEVGLRISALEQIIIHMLVKVMHQNIIQEFVEVCMKIIQKESLPDLSSDNRLKCKAVQVLVLSVQNYPGQARLLHQVGLDFICLLLPFIFSDYKQLQYYSLFLIQILVFSKDLPKNKFLPGDQFELIPQAADKIKRIRSIPILGGIGQGFFTPFSTQFIKLKHNPQECDWLQYWSRVPSSQRIHDYLNMQEQASYDKTKVLQDLIQSINQAETHADILKTVYAYVNLVKTSYDSNHRLYESLINIENSYLQTLLSIVRVPPTNITECYMTTYLLQFISIIIELFGDNQYELLFIGSISSILQSNLLPFAQELDDLDGNTPAVFEILQILNQMIAFHGLKIPRSGEPIQILNRFQTQPNQPNFILNLISRVLEFSNNSQLQWIGLKTLTNLIENVAINIALDLKGSPITQQSIQYIANIVVNKIQAYTSNTSLENKFVVKQGLRFLNLVHSYFDYESWAWCLRCTENRDSVIRMLSWSILQKKVISVMAKTTNLVDIALDALFAQKDTYGAKVQIYGFLLAVSEIQINEEIDQGNQYSGPMFKFGIVSHIKTVLYDNQGPSKSYFPSMIALLNNLYIINPEKVKSQCIQLDIWDGIIRLIRPNSLIERFNFEKRKLQSKEILGLDDTLITLIYGLNFISNIIRNDAQIGDFLVDQTHLIDYSLQQLKLITDNFNESLSALQNKTMLAIINTLHSLCFISNQKCKKILLHRFNYQQVLDVFDKSSGIELRLGICRLLTCLTEIIDLDHTAEGLIVHVISLYKQVFSSDNIRGNSDILNCLMAMLYRSESAKQIALKVGFQDIYFQSTNKLYSQVLNQQGQKIDEILNFIKYWCYDSDEAKLKLLYNDGHPGPVALFIFHLIQVGQGQEALLVKTLETLSTIISDSSNAKKACAIVQESRQSILSQLVQLASISYRNISEQLFQLVLQVLGSLSRNKECRQLMIKSKYPQGLCQTLVKQWNLNKDETQVPAKSAQMVYFLSILSFYTEGQKVIIQSPGLVQVLGEILERYSSIGISYRLVMNTFLLIRNLAFLQGNNAQLLSEQRILTMLLATLSSSYSKMKIRQLAASAIWALLYHNQRVKGLLSRQPVLDGLDNIHKEIERDLDRARYENKKTDKLNDVSTSLACILKICRD